MAKLEKEKQEQDFRIDALQENLKGLQQQLALVSAQYEAQVCMRAFREGGMTGLKLLWIGRV